MRLGLAGPGLHGKRYLYRQNGGERFALVCYRGAQAAKIVVEPDGLAIEQTSDLDRFFSAGLDGVVIATPPDTHRALALRAIKSGIPVLVEKPLALNWEDCEEIILAAELADVPLLVGHIHLFAESFEPLIESRKTTTIAIGGPQGNHDYSALYDWGSHAVAMALAIGGYNMPNWKVWARGSGVWDIAIATPHCTQNVSISPERQLRVTEGKTTLYTGKEPASQTPMARMVEVFEKLIRGGSDPRADLDFTRAVYVVLSTAADTPLVN